jgi:hypothetical protein
LFSARVGLRFAESAAGGRMKRVYAVLLLGVASLLSSACYVKQDQMGNWWACDTIQTANGPAEACQPLPARPF